MKFRLLLPLAALAFLPAADCGVRRYFTCPSCSTDVGYQRKVGVYQCSRCSKDYARLDCPKCGESYVSVADSSKPAVCSKCQTTFQSVRCPSCGRLEIFSKEKYRQDCASCGKIVLALLDCAHCSQWIVWPKTSGLHKCEKCSKDQWIIYCSGCKRPSALKAYGSFTCWNCGKRDDLKDLPCPSCGTLLNIVKVGAYKCPSCSKPIDALNCRHCGRLGVFSPEGPVVCRGCGKGASGGETPGKTFVCPHCQKEWAWPEKEGRYDCSGCGKFLYVVGCKHCGAERVHGNVGGFKCGRCGRYAGVVQCFHCRHAQRAVRYTGAHRCESCGKETYAMICPHCRAALVMKEYVARANCGVCKKDFDVPRD